MLLDLSMHVLCKLVHGGLKLCLFCVFGLGFFCQLVQVYWYIVWKLRKRNGVDDSNSIILLNFSLNQWGCNIYLNPCRFLCVSHLTLANRRIQLKSGARYYTSLLFLVIRNTALINLMPTHLFCGQQYSLQDLWL